MTPEQIKSLIRHGLTGLGAILGFLGLTKLAGFTELLLTDFDSLWNAAFVIVGAVVAYLGYWKDKTRFTDRDNTVG